MSLAALTLATRNVLRTALGITGTDAEMALKCDLALGGKPHPAAGQVFYAVHPYGWDNGPQGDYDYHERMGVKVTVSMKVGVSPRDRTLTAMWMTPTTGLDALCRVVMLAIARQQSIRAAANVILGGSDIVGDGKPNGFETELWFERADPEPVERDDMWFGADPVKATGAVAGLSVTLTFGRADRNQALSGAT